MKKILFICFLFLVIGCSKSDNDEPINDTPQYTITVSSTPGGSVSTTGGTYD